MVHLAGRRHLLEFIAAAVRVDCATVVDGKPSILLSDSCTAGALINVQDGRDDRVVMIAFVALVAT